ncbi:MAG: N-acetylmuramoyl-L-alanine amidase [Clostridia bacterium]|nr:N-acetylmuramoyl-L-alanine amidase [Clostridia bacterium]
MKAWWRGRQYILAAVGLCLLAGAVAPRMARPAVPAKPVQQADGPLQGMTILVDAGHGGTDGGATARDSGIPEKELNLQVALLLGDALRQSGARVILTRETDMEYSRNKREDLTARLRLAREGNADLLISIHMNEYRLRGESGPQVFYRPGQEQSRLLAGAIQEAMLRELKPARERAAMAGDYFILSLDIPSALVECGFLSNAAEEKLLLTEDYQRRVAQAIRDGIVDYVSLRITQAGARPG